MKSAFICFGILVFLSLVQIKSTEGASIECFTPECFTCANTHNTCTACVADAKCGFCTTDTDAKCVSVAYDPFTNPAGNCSTYNSYSWANTVQTCSAPVDQCSQNNEGCTQCRNANLKCGWCTKTNNCFTLPGTLTQLNYTAAAGDVAGVCNFADMFLHSCSGNCSQRFECGSCLGSTESFFPDERCFFCPQEPIAKCFQQNTTLPSTVPCVNQQTDPKVCITAAASTLSLSIYFIELIIVVALFILI